MPSFMTSRDRKSRASAFVHLNSEKVAAELPHNELAQFLHSREQNNDAIEEIESVHNSTFPTQCLDSDMVDNLDAQELFEECQKLKKTWQDFQTKHVRFQDLDTKRPASFQDLQSIMRTTVQDWDARCDSGLSKAKNNFLSFSETLLQFSDLFSIIPNGDKYVSLFTGVISTTVKAAGRRTEIAEVFSSALAEIGKVMCLGKAVLSVHEKSDVIRNLVIRLYIKYSIFFCHFMEWHLGSSWSRLKTTLRNDYSISEVKPHVTEITNICKMIESQARLISERDIQTVLELVQNLESRVEIGLEHTDKRLQELRRLLLAVYSHDTVAATAERHMYDADVANATGDARNTHAVQTDAERRPLSQLPNGLGTIEQPNASSSLVPTEIQTRDTLKRASLELLKYLPVTDAGMENFENSRPGTHLIPAMMIAKLGDWAGSSRPEMLWIIGAAFSNLNYASLAAWHINNMAAVANIPCISMFCTPDAKFADPVDQKQSREMDMLIALLYKLIHRLVIIAEESLVDIQELCIIISSLNGQKDTISMALQAVRILLRHRSPLLLVILDGLEQVDTGETEPYLSELIEMIYADMTPSSRLKVLLGSQGYLRSGRGVKEEDCLDCAFLPSSRPGHALPGGRFVNEIDGDVFSTSH